jgi:nitroimidazol reductase NimA-like FMN-containing flavoprotein (pyridoxamine 5'-phosphate oxidase superfamily)
MRMTTRICEDAKKINLFLSRTQTGYLGLSTGDMPYIVPLNYVWDEGIVYFHGAGEGRKVDMIQDNPNATFVVSENFGAMTDPIPAETDTAYLSVMLFGKAEIVDDLSEATSAMQKLLNKYVPGYYNTPLSENHVEKYRSSIGSKTVVFKLVATKITAKENVMVEEKAFYKGRDVRIDLKK